MSMTDNGQPVDETSKPSLNPPPIGAVGGGGSALRPDQRLEPRKIKGVSPGVSISEEGETQFFDPKTQMYTGQKLVNSKGVISREQYNDNEAYSVLASYTAAERKALLNIFQQVGIFGRSKPDPGFSDKNLSAVREAFLYANYKGVTLDVAATQMLTDPEFREARATGGGARVRTTPKQDLRAVFKQSAQQILGRDLPDSEVDRFVRAYTASEIREAQGGEAAPSVATAAEEQIMAGQGAEAGAVGFLSLANIMDRAIKELG